MEHIKQAFKKCLQELLIEVKYPKDKKHAKLCVICLTIYDESNLTEHNKTDKHVNFSKLNEKLRKLKNI